MNLENESPLPEEAVKNCHGSREQHGEFRVFHDFHDAHFAPAMLYEAL